MMKKLSLFLVAIAMGTVVSTMTAQVTPTAQMEQLGRGVVALPAQSGSGQFVSWRLLGTDNENVTFDVVRDGTVIARDLAGASSFVDRKGTATSQYQVVAKVNGNVQSTSAAVTPWAGVYTTLQLDQPTGGSYTPNDCSVGDVDGDGEYELIVKWDSNGKDNASSGVSDPCIIDCYEFDGTKRWRVNLGKNIRSGAHYTQFMVYDFNGDGKAEMMCKTAPGSVDGKGNYVTAAADDNNIKSANNTANYVGSDGRVLKGPEYLTVFNGETGAAMHTIWYNPNRAGNYGQADDHPGESFWGDSKGNRGDRFLAAVAHLDGAVKKASGIFCRGYYRRAYVWAVDFDGQKLKHRWLHCSSSKTAYSVTDANFNTSNYTNTTSTSGGGSATLYQNGNHNISIADVDGDGKDEIIWGSAACDDNGKVLYGVGFGHGDAMHLADHLPDRPGLEVFDVHEEKGTYAWDLHDAKTGQVLLKGGPAGVDNGRGLAAQYDANFRGSYFGSAADVTTRKCTDGSAVSEYGPTVFNFRIYWDGDLQEECLGDISNHNNPFLEKWNGNGFSRMYIAGKNVYQHGTSVSINSTKGNPCLQADIFGDWREEMIFYDGSNPSVLNIFTTNIPTSYRVVTLMHDHVYRMGVAWQNVAYNQPPHLGYYLPDYAKKQEAEVVEDNDDDMTVFYKQDYESETDASSWISGDNQGNAQSRLSLQKGDATYGKYIQFAPEGDNSRACYTSISSGDNTTYVLDFDLALRPSNKEAHEFVVMAASGTPEVGYNGVWYTYSLKHNQQHALLTLANGGAGDTFYEVNFQSAETVELASDVWNHVRLKVDGTSRKVDYVISSTDKTVLGKGTFNLPEGTSSQMQGFYFRCGRYQASMKIDNVVISVPATVTPEPEPEPEPEPDPEPEPVIADPIDPELSFSVTTVAGVVGEAFTAPVLSNRYNIEVEWSSEHPEVATVDNQGNVTLVGAGQTTITASFTGDDNYTSSEAHYQLTVTAPEPEPETEPEPEPDPEPDPEPEPEPEPEPDPILDSIGKVTIGTQSLPVYNMMGQRTYKLRKGLNIIGDRKVFVK